MIRCLPIFASLLVAGLCGSLSGCSKPIEQGRYETIILHTMALEGDSTPAVVPVVNEKCDGSGFITHGDGHRTPCPGCENCRKSEKRVQCTNPECSCVDCTCSPACLCAYKAPSSLGTDASDTDWSACTFFVCEGTECKKVRAPVRRYRGKLWGWYGGKMYVIANGRATPHRSTAGGSCSDGSCSTSASGGGGGCASCGAGRFGRRR